MALLYRHSPPIVLTANPETPGVAIIEPGDVAGVEFELAKRKRCKPKKFEAYTDPTRKKAHLDAIDDVPLVLDPLKKPLATQYRTVSKWLLGDIPNKTKRDVQTGVYGSSWFLTMKTPQFWIDDGHIDAAKHMLRRRRQFYPGAYRQDAVVMNIMFSQVVPGRYVAYQNAKETDKKRFLWDSDVISMITGIDNQFMASWKGVDTVYWCQNYLQAHWFAVEASISTWTLNVYDSDVTVISDKQLQSFMKSWSTLFPSLLLQSQLFKDDPRLTIHLELKDAKSSMCTACQLIQYPKPKSVEIVVCTPSSTSNTYWVGYHFTQSAMTTWSCSETNGQLTYGIRIALGEESKFRRKKNNEEMRSSKKKKNVLIAA
ncbi:uncharacterized protein LOC133800023 [Humulus lupulus]|uniref:uncharacterized protein LOC133800023 n=1 Tax=Humulus lupulus TaxID=3486 RepID=UPI002B40D6CD|nr:uncharacterized protein LOC133800023 [Humulus lupulus]